MAGASIPLALLSGGLYALAFPPFDLGLCACFALVPLLVAVRGRRPLAALTLGWLAGSIAIHVLVTLSIREAAGRFLPTHPGLGWLMAIGLPQLYVTPWFAGFAAAVAAIGRGVPTAWQPLAIAVAWSAGETLRSSVGDGAPWVLLGHALHASPLGLQTADLGGAPAVGCLVALVNAAIASGLDRRVGRGRLVAVMVAAVIVAAAFAYGRWRLEALAADGGPGLRVVLVQPDVPDAWREGFTHVRHTLERLRSLTQTAVTTDPDLVVWPENAVSVSVTDNAPVFADVAARLGASSHRLLLGAPRSVPNTDGTLALRNAAFLLDPTGRVTNVYDKRRLTPYGEVMPRTIAFLLGRPTDAGTEYQPGVDGELFAVAGHRFAVVICWEAIYADLLRPQVRAGAEFLVNISNDGWFGRAPSLAQHFHATQLRAVEYRRWLLRGTNAGITAAVDPRGVVMATAPAETATILPVTITPRTDLTVYARIGDAFGWACVGATLMTLWRTRSTTPRGWQA